jgi:hypothetical protein
VIIGTYRSGYSDINPALVRTLEELIRIGVRPHKLGGLSKDAVAQMLRGLSQREAPENLLVEEGKLFDAAGQFRAELKLDESDVPENVRLIISRRLQRLDENEKVHWLLPR